MHLNSFSKKQLKLLNWWLTSDHYDAIICDGSIRSGKTFCMSLSFFLWSFFSFKNSAFAICGKTIRSVKRNVCAPIIPILENLGFRCNIKLAENILEVYHKNHKNIFYLFGGKDESSASLIQGITLCGTLFDEVALMPRSFVEQALARCSDPNSKFWFNCNPEHPGHWFYKEWILKADSKNCLYLHFTMKDNPSLSDSTISRYENLYTGPFYERFIRGKWVAPAGIIYPFMSDPSMFCSSPVESEFESYAVSCDYGTVNPCSFGLWGKLGSSWFRFDEYYFDSKKEGFQKTDEEHYDSLIKLISNRNIQTIVVDPSAASFIAVIKKHSKFNVTPAKNQVLDGIRQVSTALKSQKIKICKNCLDSIREFSLYRWDSHSNYETPIKENDHAMDDIRYFVTTVLQDKRYDDFCVFSVSRNS